MLFYPLFPGDVALREYEGKTYWQGSEGAARKRLHLYHQFCGCILPDHKERF